jgi:hypothetical protein
MKPINFNTETTTIISSNSIVWQGPDLPCINLCKGDTISDIVYKLAIELCNVLDSLDIKNYDLSCFNINSCAPSNFQQLIQFLITQICSIQDTINSSTTTPVSGSCPDCLVTVADCFVSELGTTAQLVDYVNAAATKICTLILQVSIINSTLANLNARVTTLEGYFPLPAPAQPQITPVCVLPATPTNISVVLSALEAAYCDLVAQTGTPAELINTILSQCVADGDLRKDGGGTMSSIPGWFSSPVANIAESITNIWLTVCDLRNAPTVTVAVTDSQTIDMTVTGAPAYSISAEVVDSGWHDLEGFDYYSGAMLASKPKARRVGNVIHFKGLVYVPLSSTIDGLTLVPLTASTTYNSEPTPYTFGGIDGTYGNGVQINAAGLISFNQNVNCVPAAVWAGSLDDQYIHGNIIATREINLTVTNGTILSSLFYVYVTSGGVLSVATLNNQEISSTRPAGQIGSAPLRLITSNVRSGEFVPDYLGTGTDIHNGPSNANFPLLSDVTGDTWPFSCDAGNQNQIGGFTFKLDGLMAYVAP